MAPIPAHAKTAFRPSRQWERRTSAMGPAAGTPAADSLRPMSLEGRHVAVVGAGVGGIATALLSARAGARVTLIEREPEPRAVGAGILLQPNGLAVLYGLDLDERLLRRGTRLSSLRVADATGRTIVDVAVPRFAAGLDHALVLRRQELLSALLDLVVAEDGVECRFGREVVDVSPAGELTHRGCGGTERVAADVVVGADGVHSAVRRRSRLRVRVGRSFRYVRGLGPDLALHGMTEYWTGLGIFGVAPLPGGSYFYASTRAEPLARALREDDAGYFRDTWQRELPLAGEMLAGIRRMEDLVVSHVIRVDAEQWTAGRVVLLGDAAHAMAPNLGQGAGSALADAAVLVRELAQPGEMAPALARYEARRRPAVRAVQDIAGWLGWLSDLGPAGLRVVRDGVLHRFGPWLLGEVGMRLVEQQDPLWLRIAAANPTEALEPA
jgi:2-polyprenyl-6-methoxyphenol hydroxylase-like FAD-dependent oxidoreductase